jgi:hypothetical protein
MAALSGPVSVMVFNPGAFPWAPLGWPGQLESHPGKTHPARKTETTQPKGEARHHLAEQLSFGLLRSTYRNKLATTAKSARLAEQANNYETPLSSVCATSPQCGQ